MTPVPLRLRRDPGGLYDLDAHRAVDLARLAEHVGDGGRFTAVAHDTGEDCTRRVLAELLGHIAAGRATGGATDALAGMGLTGALTNGIAGLLAGAARAGGGRPSRRSGDDDLPER